MRFWIASVLEVAGVAVLGTGLWMLAPWLGITIGGLGLVAFGLALDPPRGADS